MGEEPCDEKILVIGADLKHVLRTVAGSVDFKGSFRFVLADPNPHIQARNLVLLGLLLNQEPAAAASPRPSPPAASLRLDDNNGHNNGPSATVAFIRALYSLHLDRGTFHQLRNVMHSILTGDSFLFGGKCLTFVKLSSKLGQI